MSLFDRPLAVLVPCRAGSQRVPRKNVREFGQYGHGLLELKLGQLEQCAHVDTVVVSSDDPIVLDYATTRARDSAKHYDIVERPEALAIAASLDEFLAYVPTIMPAGSIVAWTHVTSPFFDSAHMDAAIEDYERHVVNGEFDSLMSVTTIQTYLWSERGCISHDREAVRWPQTQDLPKFYEVNSAWFMIDQPQMLERRDRIGAAPYLYETPSLASFDIDWPDDFDAAEKLLSLG